MRVSHHWDHTRDVGQVAIEDCERCRCLLVLPPKVGVFCESHHCRHVPKKLASYSRLEVCLCHRWVIVMKCVLRSCLCVCWHVFLSLSIHVWVDTCVARASLWRNLVFWNPKKWAPAIPHPFLPLTSFYVTICGSIRFYMDLVATQDRTAFVLRQCLLWKKREKIRHHEGEPTDDNARCMWDDRV